MAIRFVVLYLAVVAVALCFFVREVSADCRLGYGCLRTEVSPSEMHNSARKLLYGTEQVFKSTYGPLDHQKKKNHNGNVDNSWSLRTAPSGPDPLHHHGGGTKEPQTP